MQTNNSFTVHGFVIWGLCAFFFLYEFFMRTVLGTFQTNIMQDLHLSFFQFSLLSTVMYIAIYGIMQIPVGFIVDALGLRNALLLGIAICVFACFSFSIVQHYVSASVIRMLMGLGSSFGFICLLVAVYNWMPRKHSAIFIGFSQLIGTLGPIFAAGPLTMLINAHYISGWRNLFFILGFVGLFLWIAVFCVVSNNTKKTGEYKILYKSQNFFEQIIVLCKQKQAWFIALYSAAVYCALEYFSENAGHTFLMLKGLTSDNSAFVISLSWFAYALACPFLGFLSDFYQRRKAIMLLAAVFSVLSIFTIIYAQIAIYLEVAFFLLGLGAAGQSVGFCAIAEQFTPNYTAVAFGLNNAMITLLSAINAPSIGFLLDLFKKHQATLTEHAYQISFLGLLGLALFAFIIVLLFIKETYGKSGVGFHILNTATQQKT